MNHIMKIREGQAEKKEAILPGEGPETRYFPENVKNGEKTDA